MIALKKQSYQVLIGLILLISCSSQQTDCESCELENNAALEQERRGIVQNYAYKDFDSALVAKNGILIDVRTRGEYNEGSIPGATNIDWNGHNFESEIAKLDKSKPIFVFCQMGGRSAKAAQKLSAMEYELYNLLGGYSAFLNETSNK